MPKRAVVRAPRKERPKKADPRKRSRTVAENSGLDQKASHCSEALGSLHPIDEPFRLWMSLLRISPWSIVMRQQISLVKTLLGTNS